VARDGGAKLMMTQPVNENEHNPRQAPVDESIWTLVWSGSLARLPVSVFACRCSGGL